MRLIAFGCSFTYGQYLDDTIDAEGNWQLEYGPSNLAWPKRLADLLGIKEVVNMSFPGSSNKRILYEIQRFNFHKDDIVFILWALKDRYCIIKGNNIIEDIFPHREESKIYYHNIYNDYDHQLDFCTRTNYAKMHLDYQNIKHYHLSVDPQLDPMKWDSVEFLITGVFYEEERRDYYDLATDNSHPGVMSNYKFAKEIFNLIDKDEQ